MITFIEKLEKKNVFATEKDALLQARYVLLAGMVA
jgi:hypothetical protein